MEKYFNKCCRETIDKNMLVKDGDIQEIKCICEQEIICLWTDSYGLRLPSAIKKEDYKGDLI